MDALTFATPVLLRKMTFANSKNVMVQSMNYAKAIEGLGLTHDQFVDLCILLGCDYCDSIRGVGPKTALKLIREHKCIENILKEIASNKKSKYVVPDNWLPPAERTKSTGKSDNDEDDSRDGEEAPDGEETDVSPEKPPISDDNNKNDEEEDETFVPAYVMARGLFNQHEVVTDVQLKWKPCQPAELKQFLVDEMGFSAERVDNNIEKLQQAYKKNLKPQTRMDSFFAVKPGQSKKRPAAADKKKAAAANKKKKGNAGRGKR